MSLTPADPSIAPATPADISAIVSLEAQAFLRGWPEQDLCAALADESYILAVAHNGNGVLSGYACCRVIADECEVYRCAVQPSLRRRGIALQLLEFCLGIAAGRGAQRAYLEVRVNNLEARKLYEKAGFAPGALRKGYYADTGEDAVCMSTDLAANKFKPR